MRMWMVAMLVAVLSSGAAWAGPWSRATGEAVELQRSTEDLRNRLERLFRGSAAAYFAVQTDELAKQLKTASQSSISRPEFEGLMRQFSSVASATGSYVVGDPYIRGDEGVSRYLEKVNERYGRFVTDLSKSDAWTSPLQLGYPSYPGYSPYLPPSHGGYYSGMPHLHDDRDHHIPADPHGIGPRGSYAPAYSGQTYPGYPSYRSSRPSYDSPVLPRSGIEVQINPTYRGGYFVPSNPYAIPSHPTPLPYSNF